MAGQGPRLFTPGRTIWTVDREAVLLLGGGRALLLQLAHPLVAAGVADHSGVVTAPYRRLSRTLDTIYTIVFGDGGFGHGRAAEDGGRLGFRGGAGRGGGEGDS